MRVVQHDAEWRRMAVLSPRRRGCIAEYARQQRKCGQQHGEKNDEVIQCRTSLCGPDAIRTGSPSAIRAAAASFLGHRLRRCHHCTHSRTLPPAHSLPSSTWHDGASTTHIQATTRLHYTAVQLNALQCTALDISHQHSDTIPSSTPIRNCSYIFIDNSSNDINIAEWKRIQSMHVQTRAADSGIIVLTFLHSHRRSHPLCRLGC